MTNNTKDIIFIEKRILNNKKRIAFIRSMCRFVLLLESDNMYNIEYLYEDPAFTTLYNTEYVQNKEYNKGIHFAIDVFKEVYYNIYSRFEEGIYECEY